MVQELKLFWVAILKYFLAIKQLGFSQGKAQNFP